MSPLEQQKAKQDGVFAKALRDTSNAFVQMGGHPRTLLHHTRRNELIEQAIAKLQILKREGDAYHQLGQPAPTVQADIDEEELKAAVESVGFLTVDDSPVLYSTLAAEVKTDGLSLALNNPYEQIVKYSSSDESVATVDEKTGVITPVGNGEVTIHVAFTKKGEHLRVEDSFDLVIEDEQPSQEETPEANPSSNDAEASAQ